MDSLKVEKRGAGRLGSGLFAVQKIYTDELIADWTGGQIFEVEKATSVPAPHTDHAIQFAPHKWIDYDGVGRYINHSCNPNAFFKETFRVFALHDIEAGEQIYIDYETFEDSDWQMGNACLCGTKACRGIIGAFKNLDEEQRVLKKGLLHPWIKEYYGL